MTTNILLVFLGGGIGSVLRYGAGIWVYRIYPTPWPLSTWLVNILGSLLIGIVYGLVIAENQVGMLHKLLFMTGFCGGFTTFSSFSYENLMLLQDGAYLRFVAYAFSSLIVGILMVFLGYRLAGQL